MNPSFWIAKGGGCTKDCDLNNDNSSRNEHKRSYQWLVNGPESELSLNKKQIVGVPTANLFSGLLNSNVFHIGGASSQSTSGRLSKQLFDTETPRTINFDDRITPSVSKVNIGRKVGGNNSSAGLSMSEDPRSGGIRKVKVSHVKELGNVMPLSTEHAYNRVDNAAKSMAFAYERRDENAISLNHAYNKGGGGGNMMWTDERENNIFISMRRPYNKEMDERKNNIFMSIGRPYNREMDNVSQLLAYKENNNTMPMDHAFSKGKTTLASMGQIYNKGDKNSISMGHIHNKGNDNTISNGQSHNKSHNNNLAASQFFHTNPMARPTLNYDLLAPPSLEVISDKELFNLNEEAEASSPLIGVSETEDDLLMAQPELFNLNKEAEASSPLIAVSGTEDDLLMAQPSLGRSEVIPGKELVNPNVEDRASTSSTKKIAVERTTKKRAPCENAPTKKKDIKTAKNGPSNSFPSNARSLLATGLLDGVPVKYIAWSRDKELPGIIKGTGYLCGCQTCKFSKVISAYEFERHANCKSKHPNNHIYFSTGKTLYGIVHELRNTPKDMIFDAVQNITGSTINQKAFLTWKESYLIATRELERIYGKDEENPPA